MSRQMCLRCADPLSEGFGDLPARLSRRGPLNVPDTASFYGGGERCYTDCPEWVENDRLIRCT
jgi:hypothetical protein